VYAHELSAGRVDRAAKRFDHLHRQRRPGRQHQPSPRRVHRSDQPEPHVSCRGCDKIRRVDHYTGGHRLISGMTKRAYSPSRHRGARRARVTRQSHLEPYQVDADVTRHLAGRRSSRAGMPRRRRNRLRHNARRSNVTAELDRSVEGSGTYTVTTADLDGGPPPVTPPRRRTACLVAQSRRHIHLPPDPVYAQELSCGRATVREPIGSSSPSENGKTPPPTPFPQSPSASPLPTSPLRRQHQQVRDGVHRSDQPDPTI